MSKSKNRKQHHHFQPQRSVTSKQDLLDQPEKKANLVTLSILVCSILALGISWFAFGNSVIAILIGIVLGGIIGYFAGKQMEKSLEK